MGFGAISVPLSPSHVPINPSSGLVLFSILIIKIKKIVFTTKLLLSNYSCQLLILELFIP